MNAHAYLNIFLNVKINIIQSYNEINNNVYRL